ncbi:MAG: S-layer homology domain-containing protein [Peptoniphilus sp.]|uniref:S-layer homology domain-containing protein n=1 Tax=Peptoniphilus sp. TaxID=1971214 RepID=UPI00399F684D
MRNKKILGLLLAGVMVTSIPFNVFADDESEKLELSEVNTPVAVAQEKDETKPAELTEETPATEEDKKEDKKEEKEVTVTFVAVLVEKGKENSKKTLDDSTKVEKGEKIPAEKFNAPDEDGYEFGGWYADESLTTGFNKEETINSPTTVYAKYTKKAKKFTVKFKDEDKVLKSFEVEEGKTVKNTDKPENPTKEGYTFKGWSKKQIIPIFPYTVTEDVTFTAIWEKNVPAKEDLYISDIEYDGNYVTGKVTSKGKAVKDATVTLKIDESKTTYNDETDSDGRFKVYLGKYYDDYKYYYDDDYYYRYGDRYYNGYEVRRDSDGDYYYIKDGKRNYIWHSDYYRRYRDYKADLVAEKEGFYSTETNLWKDGYYYNNGRYYGRDWWYNRYDARVYPTDISRTNYSASGYLKGYKNRTVYVYDDGTYLGSSKIDSDGYFNVTWNSPYVSTSRSLEYYVNGTSTSDSTYSMIPVVNALSAGASFVRGNAGAYADVTVYDSNGTRLGGATAGSTGIFNISLNRELKAGETIKVEAKESGKISRSTEVKIAGQEAKVTAEVNSPSYIAGYPDGTFKPGKEVTRAEAVRMFVSLVNNGKELPKNPTTKFKDANNKWYSDEINFAVSKGFISGYSDGTFKPNQGITRAEFAQMIAVFVKDGYPGSSNFKDVKGHWASNAIDQLYGNKTIKGFPDGTFKPDQKLTRAEAVTVLNSVFGRNTKATSFANVNTSSLRKFSDVPMSHWAYYEIIDASNGHNAVKGDKAEDVSVWQ